MILFLKTVPNKWFFAGFTIRNSETPPIILYRGLCKLNDWDMYWVFSDTFDNGWCHSCWNLSIRPDPGHQRCHRGWKRDRGQQTKFLPPCQNLVHLLHHSNIRAPCNFQVCSLFLWERKVLLLYFFFDYGKPLTIFAMFGSDITYKFYFLYRIVG